MPDSDTRGIAMARHRFGRTAVSFTIALGLVAAACGSDDAGSPGTGAAGTEPTDETTAPQATAGESGPAATAESTADTEGADTSVVSSSDIASEAQRFFDGTYQDPPATSPPAAEDKNVWVLSCGEAAVGCASLAGGIKEGAETLGWDVTLFDGKLGADGAYSTGVRQAVAAGADAIVIGAVDCALISQPLAEARAAGVLVVGSLAYDCDDPRAGGGEALFDTNFIPDSEHESRTDANRFSGEARAVWLLNKRGTSGLTVLSFRHTDSLLGTDYADGFDSKIEAKCADCTVIPVEFTFADLGTIGTKASDALTKYPDANALVVPYDSLLLLGVAQAVVRSGRSDSIDVIGNEGYAPNLELIRTNGGQDMALGSSANWAGWGTADTLNRLFAGEPAVAQGLGFKFIDAEHMPDDDGVAFIPPIDYKAAYRAAWGVS